MRELYNFILNFVFGVKLRYRNYLNVGINSFFLKSFSIRARQLKKPVIIGDNCILGAQLIAESEDAEFKFGNRVYVGSSKMICRQGIEFEDDIMVAWGVTFYDHDSHSLDFNLRQKDILQQVDNFINHRGDLVKNKNWNVVNAKSIKVCRNAWIGMNATILKGVCIGEGSIVAACSVVTKDVPPFSVVAGNPAVVVKRISQIS